MPTPRAPLALIALAALAAATPPALAAQQPDQDATVPFVGVVVDSATGQPVPGALVKLMVSKRQTMTDEAGRFAFDDVEPGTIYVSVDQMGYVKQSLAGEAGADAEPMRVEIAPRPVVLEGLSVMVDRLEQRRRAIGTSSRVLRTEDLIGRAGNMYHILMYTGGVNFQKCSAYSGACARRRGSVVPAQLYIDDHPAIGGLNDLSLYQPSEVYAMEIYAQGSVINVYTRGYMERVARSPRVLKPVMAW